MPRATSTVEVAISGVAEHGDPGVAPARPVLQSGHAPGSTPDAAAPHMHRALDGLSALCAAVLLAVLAWWALPLRPFERSLASALASSPAWLRGLWVVAYDVTVAVAIGTLVVLAARRRWSLLAKGVAGGAFAYVLVLLTSRLGSGVSLSASEAFGAGHAAAWPTPALAIAGGIYLGLRADVSESLQKAGWRLLLVGSAAAVLAGRGTPSAVLAALLVAAIAGALARLAFGTAAGHVSAERLPALLEAIGLGETAVESVALLPDGMLVAHARRAADGRRLVVKVRSRDAAENRRVQRLWRAIAYRDGGAALAHVRAPGFASEALATLLAATHRVPVWEVVTTGRADGSVDLLVLAADGRRAASLPADGVDEAAAASAWTALQQLHAARIAHLAISPHAMALREDGTIALTDLGDARLSPSEAELRTDDAQLAASLAVLVGVERTVAGAHRALDDETLHGLLPFLQLAALPAPLRAALREAGIDLEELRSAIAGPAGTEPPELARLRRVTWGRLLMVAMMVLAAYTILPALADLDLDRLRTQLSSAAWGFAIAGFVVAQLPRLAQTLSTMGAIPARLPFLPVYMMQLAMSFVNLVLPAAPARMALTVRFFQRQGVEPATAVTSALIDSFVGNVVQGGVLIGLLVFTSVSLDLESRGSFPPGGWQHVGIAAAVLLVALVAVALAARRLARRLIAKLRGWWPSIRAAIATLGHAHKLGQLIGGNLAAELLFATALALVVRAFSPNISLVEALFVNVSAGLLTTLIPVPGGIGVAEGGLIVGLTSVGVSEEAAFATTMLYRLFTFYLPPIWGWAALRWLTRKKYV